MSLDTQIAVIASTIQQFENWCSQEGIHPRSKGVIYVDRPDRLRGRRNVRPIWITATHPHAQAIRQELDMLAAVGGIASFPDQRHHVTPEEKTPVVKPTLCRAVLYRSKTGRYTLAADVIGTEQSLFQPGVDAGMVPSLDSDMHVHLLVKTPGKPGGRLPDTDPSIAAVPMGGTYVEYNIPFWDPIEATAGNGRGNWELDDQPAGTWTWPPRS